MKKKTEQTADKGKELFDFIKMIQEDQRIDSFDSMTEVEKKKYGTSRYMIHRFLSMNPSFSLVVNLIQQYTSIPNRQHYMFLTNMLPRGRQYNKYIKGVYDSKYEDWLVTLVSNHYNISSVEAITYLDIYYKSNKPALKILCEKYGIDQKLVKKAKL